ncbi:MAG: sulfite exporter TauE/SafE family protein [Candidatus Aenigmarchaeota archaeon]|nr:sulfite exporter TauE/SafE family protein [Candidatus Aenigmarchaeota archaeon]
MIMGRRAAVFLNSVAFVMGFTLVFSLVGVLLQTLLSGVAFDAMNILRSLGGMIIILFGMLLIVSLKYRVPFLSSEHKIKVRVQKGYISSFVFGIAFAIGWTPCVGAILGAIYTLAAVSPGIGFLLLFAYSLGIGVPFLIAGAFASRISGFLEKSQNILKYFNIIGGLLLVTIGALVLFNYIGILAGFFVGAEGVAVAGQLNFFIAFVAGVVTFISPCILPLLPAFFSYMAGTTAGKAKKK